MKTLVVAPHPDDELLGCGGTLLKRSAEGGSTAWLLMTSMNTDLGWTQSDISRRESEIERVRHGLNISDSHLFKLDLPAANLDKVPKSEIIKRLSHIFQDFQPQEILLPHPGDIHSDHVITFESASACTKWFRYPSIKRILTYETISETDFGFNFISPTFKPNLFVDISNYLDRKVDLLRIYESEISTHPFPRNIEAIKAQALLRGVQRGTQACEAFQILRQFE